MKDAAVTEFDYREMANIEGNAKVAIDDRANVVDVEPLDLQMERSPLSHIIPGGRVRYYAIRRTRVKSVTFLLRGLAGCERH